MYSSKNQYFFIKEWYSFQVNKIFPPPLRVEGRRAAALVRGLRGGEGSRGRGSQIAGGSLTRPFFENDIVVPVMM